MDLIIKYFPDLTQDQIQKFEQLQGLYLDWNSKINVISRKDVDQLYLRHVLHSLAIARVCEFGAGARIADVGCGGGFPSIPLAIIFPEAKFTAIDSIGKKISVVKAIAQEIGLNNIKPTNSRIEAVDEKFDYVVSRAVTEMDRFIKWVWPKIEKGSCGTLKNGILYLKGGDLAQELNATHKKHEIFNVDDFFTEDFFVGKKVVYFPKV